MKHLALILDDIVTLHRFSNDPFAFYLPIKKGLHRVLSDARQCTGGLNTQCTPPYRLEGYEITLAISWKRYVGSLNLHRGFWS